MGFFLQWERSQAAALRILDKVQSTGPCLVTHTATGFTLSELTAHHTFTGHSIRCFTTDVPAELLEQLLQIVAAPMRLQSFQPHPELPAALRLDLTGPLTETAITALRALGAQTSTELVYLQQQISLASPGVLVMDMDSTAIEIECIDEIAKLAGVGAEVAAVTARAMNGELDFAQSLRQRVAALAGAPEQVLAQVLAQLPLMPGLTALVRHLQQHHWQVVIASGGFTYFTDALKQQLALTATFANVLEIQHGKLTGQVLGDIVDANRKAQVVTEIARQFQLQQTVAIGDGANDLPMLKTADLGVAFHAKPLVQAQAKAAIRQGSLLQLLYLMEPASHK